MALLVIKRYTTILQLTFPFSIVQGYRNLRVNHSPGYFPLATFKKRIPYTTVIIFYVILYTYLMALERTKKEIDEMRVIRIFVRSLSPQH